MKIVICGVFIIIGIWILGATSKSIEYHNNPNGWPEPILKLVSAMENQDFFIVGVPPANTMHSNRINLTVMDETTDTKLELGMEWYREMPEDAMYHIKDWDVAFVGGHYLIWVRNADHLKNDPNTLNAIKRLRDIKI